MKHFTFITTMEMTYPATSWHPSQEGTGDTITVTENVGEQGRVNCVCLYDNSFQIQYLPPRPFTLVIKIVSSCFGTTGQSTIYQHTFE